MTPPATSEPDAPAPIPLEPEPTATVYDPFVPAVDDPEPTAVTEDATKVATKEASGKEEPPSFDVSAFRERVSELVGDVDGELEIVVALADETVIFERDSRELMESASLYKLAIMVELFRQRDAGELSFDDAIVLLPDYFTEDEEVYDRDWIGSRADLGSLLTNMITLSSNVAAAALLARLGNDAINATMASMGLSDTVIRWTPGIWVPAGSAPDDVPPRQAVTSRSPAVIDDAASGSDVPPTSVRAEEALNVTTAADVAALFVMLLNGEVVSPEASAEMLELLTRQQIMDRLPRYLPDDAVVAHKTGNWEGLVHDAGVIWSPSGPIIVVVMSDIYDEGRAVELIADIALEAYLLER